MKSVNICLVSWDERVIYSKCRRNAVDAHAQT